MRTRVTRETAQQIAVALAAGGSYRQVAYQFNVNTGTVYDVKKGKHWSQRSPEQNAAILEARFERWEQRANNPQQCDASRFSIWAEVQSGASLDSFTPTRRAATVERKRLDADTVRHVEALLIRGMHPANAARTAGICLTAARTIAAGRHAYQLGNEWRLRPLHEKRPAPTRREIQRACRQIRKSWTAAERRLRWEISRTFGMADEYLQRRIQST